MGACRSSLFIAFACLALTSLPAFAVLALHRTIVAFFGWILVTGVTALPVLLAAVLTTLVGWLLRAG